MNQVFPEVIQLDEKGDKVYGTVRPELIQQLTQNAESVRKDRAESVGKILSVPENPLLSKLKSLANHGEAHPVYCEYIKAQVEQMQASNGYVPPVQMH